MLGLTAGRLSAPGASTVAGSRRRLGASQRTVAAVTPPGAGLRLELERLRLPLLELVSWRWCWSLTGCRYRCWVAGAGPRARRHYCSSARRRCLVLELTAGAGRDAAVGTGQRLELVEVPPPVLAGS